ncbi:MAG: hypothetical protein VX738_16690 [Planctomycetota bacterium]|nr:hypothetical protein [Planctomycetota bacterium]
MNDSILSEIPRDALVLHNQQWLEYCQWIAFKQELEEEAVWYFQEVESKRPLKPR